MTGFERRAVAAGDEALIDAVAALSTARRSYAAGGQMRRALTVEALRDLLVEEGNAFATHSETAQ